jgi:hypothetical protein
MDIALFFHLLGVVLLFVALGITQFGGARLRRTAKLDEAKVWITMLEHAGRLFGPAFVLILGAGIYMASDTWGFERPFINVGLISVVVMIAAGGGYVGRTFTKLGKSLDAGEVRAAELPALINRRGLWAVNFSLDTLAVGVIWVMVAKPDWAQAVAVAVGTLALGAVVGGMIGGRSPAPAK